MEFDNNNLLPIEYYYKWQLLNMDKSKNTHITNLFDSEMISNLYNYHIRYKCVSKYIIHDMTGEISIRNNPIFILDDFKSRDYILENKHQLLCDKMGKANNFF